MAATLTGVVHRSGKLLEGIEPKPNVAIHPNSFRDHRVTLVPIMVEPASGKTIRGTLLAKIFRGRADKSTDLDLGVVGPVREIAEPDLVELIKAEVAKADIETTAKESVSSYWRRASFVEPPNAAGRLLESRNSSIRALV